MRKVRENIIIRPYDAPCGVLMLGSYYDKLCLCDWSAGKSRGDVRRRLGRTLEAGYVEGDSPAIRLAAAQLDEYFCGRRHDFDMPLMFAGSDFQTTVWSGLLNIPYGLTLSYSGMARHIGRPRSVRAVANAIGANAISIFVPCHRIIGNDGTLTGYRGGLDVKEYLLRLENIIP